MTKSELKKAYKKYARENKTKGYKYGMLGAVFTIIGFITVMPVAVLSLMNKIDIITHFTYISPGAVILIIGMIFDIVAEACKSKELKEFSAKSTI